VPNQISSRCVLLSGRPESCPCAYFVAISSVSLFTWRISHYWRGCFLLCSIALDGWMIFYSALLRLGGGVTIFRNNILLIWFLIFAAFVSALARFAGTHRYAAVLVIGLALITFHIAVPGLIALSTMVRLTKQGRAQATPRPRG